MQLIENICIIEGKDIMRKDIYIVKKKYIHNCKYIHKKPNIYKFGQLKIV